MATQSYRYALQDFKDAYDIEWDIENQKILKSKAKSFGKLSDFKNEKSKNVKSYLDTLSAVLASYIESKTKIGEGQYYDAFTRSKIPFTNVVELPKKKDEKTEENAEKAENENVLENPGEEKSVKSEASEEESADELAENEDAAIEEEDLPEINIGEVIMSFEKLMSEKHASDVAEGKTPARDRKPFEGLSYETLTKSVMANVNKLYDKSLADVWTKRITDEKGFFENMQKETAKTAEPIEKLIKRPMDAISRNPFVDCSTQIRMLVTAKKAMEKVVAGRGRLWKIWPGNWGRNAQEKAYLQSLKDQLESYKKQGLSDALLDIIVGDDSRSVIHGTEKEAEKSIQEYKESLKNEEVSESKDVRSEKVTSAEKAKELFANNEYMENIRDEIYSSIDFSKSPTNFKDNLGAKKIWFVQFRAFTTPDLKSMWEGFENANGEAARKKVLEDGAKKLFSTVEKQISLFSFSAADKYVEAQRITDFLMKKCSPAGIDEKYAKYTDKYFLRNVNAEDMPIDKDAYESKEKVIAYRKNLLAEARELAGIKKEPIQIPELSENFDNVKKSEKIEESLVNSKDKALE